MKIAKTGSNNATDLTLVLKTNSDVLETLPKPGFWSSGDTAKANEHWLRAKEYLKSLRAAQERMEHTHTTLQSLLAEIETFIDQCRQLDAEHRRTLKRLFSRQVISFAPPPRIENGWLFQAIRERLTTRMRYLEQFMAEVRGYNNVVRDIRHYHDVNLHKPLFGAAYIEGFPTKDALPVEIRIS